MKRVHLIQQTPLCSDFDVVLPDERTPAFRVVLPEKIFEGGRDLALATHMLPGEWNEHDGTANGVFQVEGLATVSVTVEPEESGIGIRLAIRNVTEATWSQVRVEICSAVNHLPGDPSWANESFVPGLPLDRDLQGRWWFQYGTPHGLAALTETGWVPMHPRQANPDPDSVPKYSFVPSAVDDCWACAVPSHDGSRYFYQTWDTRCLHLTPCPGNACMHLWPLVANALRPGEEGQIVGRIGIFAGTRDQLETMLRELRGVSGH